MGGLRCPCNALSLRHTSRTGASDGTRTRSAHLSRACHHLATRSGGTHWAQLNHFRRNAWLCLMSTCRVVVGPW